MKKGNLRHLLLIMMVILSAGILMACGNNNKKEEVSFDVSEVIKDLAYGQELDLSSLKISYKLGDAETVIYDWSDFDYDIDFGTYTATTPGEHTITLHYKTFSKSFMVTVAHRLEKGFSVVLTDIETEVAYGANINWSLIKVYKVLQDDSLVLLEASEYEIDYSSVNFEISGTYLVEINYLDFDTYEFEVVVLPAEEVGFEVDTSLIGNTIEINQSVNWDNLIVRAVFEDGSKTLLDASKYEIDDSALNTSEYGTYEIRVTYKEYQVFAFEMTVVAQSIKDGETVVVYSHANYTFSGATNLTIEDMATGQVTNVDDLIINELPAGEYTLRYKNSQGLDREKALISVDYLQIFGAGNDIVAQRDALVNGQYLNSEIDPYLVGIQNEFIFDLKLIGVSNNQVVGNTNLLTYSFKKYNQITQEFETVDIDDIATVNGEEFVFNSNLVGQTFKVTITPRYQDLSETVFEFKLNDAINVHTHEQLKEAFGDLNVSQINIHREIIASLSAEQYNPDGTAKNFSMVAIGSYLEVDENGKLTKNETGNIYVRYSRNVEEDQLIVNGNHFSINATQLPLLTTNENNYANQPGELGIIDGTNIVNVQTSVFFNSVKSSDFSQKATDAITNGLSRQAFDQIEKNKVVFNNISVFGNTKAPVGDMTNEEIKKMVYENSGGYILLRSENDIEVNNAVLKFAVISLTVNEFGTDALLNYANIEENWANAIYGYAASHVSLQNSEIRNSGGAAVWLEDNDYRAGIATPSFEMDENSIIDNFVAGTEPWFEAHGISLIAPGLKVGVDDGVATASGNTRTIIETRTNQTTGATFEGFNFAVALVEVYKLPQGQSDYDRPKFEVDGVFVERTHPELDVDPRNSDAGFVFPVGQYSSLANFGTLVNSLVPTYGENAGNMAMFTAFTDENAKYLEVVVIPPIAYFKSITMITEFFNK